MKKVLILSLCALMFGFAAYSQASINPEHDFYKKVERWETMGLIDQQLPLRPYPLQVVEEILTEVIETENESESAAASELYEDIFGKVYKIRMEGLGNIKLNSDDNDKQALGFFAVDGDASFSEYVTAGYQIGFSGVMFQNDEVKPAYSQFKYYMRDPAQMGPLGMFLEIDGGVAAGFRNLYFQAGISHNTFGPFYDSNSVISPEAKHTANFTITYNPGRWSYTQSLIGLSAANHDPEDLSEVNDLFSQKYLAIHSVNAKIFEWLYAGFYETSVYGGRFEPAYIIPVPYMVTQGLSGFDDNVLMGLSLTVKPRKNFSWITDIYLDDLGVNEMVKLNFDTKIRGTFQTGINYVPLNLEQISMIRLNYTAVTPYMYTHKQNIINGVDGSWYTGSLETINYQEYTTAGYPLVPGLEPNTDRIALSVDCSPVKNLNLTLKGSFMRHANVNENLPVEEAVEYLNAKEGYFSTDGGITNHSHYFEGDDEGNPEDHSCEYLPSAWDHYMFMCQDTKMYVVQGGLDIEYIIPKTKIGSFAVKLGYLFEYIHNYGVGNQIFKGNAGKGKDYERKNTETDVRNAIEEWKKGLTNVVNHYISLDFKYTW